MDITKFNKTELLNLCKDNGIIKCSTKNKSQLIELIIAKKIQLQNKIMRLKQKKTMRLKQNKIMKTK